MAALRGRIGMPLRIELAEGETLSFTRKYLLRPSRSPLADADLSSRASALAAQIVESLDADWAVRIDLIHERSSDRLLVLECDAAPLIGAQSAFAASLSAAKMSRREQLQLLLSAPSR